MESYKFGTQGFPYNAVMQQVFMKLPLWARNRLLTWTPTPESGHKMCMVPAFI